MASRGTDARDRTRYAGPMKIIQVVMWVCATSACSMLPFGGAKKAPSAPANTAANADEPAPAESKPKPADDAPKAKVVDEAGPGPQVEKDYYALAHKCTPACYEPELKERSTETIRACGWDGYTLREHKLGAGKWGKAEKAGNSWGDPIPVACNEFPKPQAKWGSVLADGKKALEVKKGDVLVIEPEADWEIETDDMQQVVARVIAVRLYQHDVETHASVCGAGGKSLLFCEKGGSRIAIAVNGARFFLAKAKELQQGGKKNGCRTAAWAAAAFASGGKGKRESLKNNHEWISAGHYVLREGNEELTEKQLVAALDEAEQNATKLFQACGGQGAPPLDGNSRAGGGLYGDVAEHQHEK